MLLGSSAFYYAFFFYLHADTDLDIAMLLKCRLIVAFNSTN